MKIPWIDREAVQFAGDLAPRLRRIGAGILLVLTAITFRSFAAAGELQQLGASSVEVGECEMCERIVQILRQAGASPAELAEIKKSLHQASRDDIARIFGGTAFDTPYVSCADQNLSASTQSARSPDVGSADRIARLGRKLKNVSAMDTMAS